MGGGRENTRFTDNPLILPCTAGQQNIIIARSKHKNEIAQIIRTETFRAGGKYLHFIAAWRIEGCIPRFIALYKNFSLFFLDFC